MKTRFISQLENWCEEQERGQTDRLARQCSGVGERTPDDLLQLQRREGALGEKLRGSHPRATGLSAGV